jgi:hypothetical protein
MVICTATCHNYKHSDVCGTKLTSNYDTDKNMQVNFLVLIPTPKAQSILLGGCAAGVSLGDV